eukprot:CCRYP_019763-RA/>CCRYP_019763-RA protein AED:0.19 eAED:0.20 QI:0/0/0/1/1/1/3/0/539
MSTSFSFNWSQDYSQQIVHPSTHCSDSNDNNNTNSNNYNPNNYHPTSPGMEDRNYTQPVLSPGVTPARGSPPTSPNHTINVHDPFGPLVLHGGANNATNGSNYYGNGVMTSPQGFGQQAQQQQQQVQNYTNYQIPMQTHSSNGGPMVISPDSRATPLMPHQQYNGMPNSNPYVGSNGAVLSPPVSPLWTPASPVSSPSYAYNNAPNGAAPANPFDMFGASPSVPAMAPLSPPRGNNCQHVPTTNTTNVPTHTQTSLDDEADFWADMGFGVANKTKKHSNSLPKGGEYYKARVTTPLIGAIFSSATELRNTLFSSSPPALVDVLDQRPVVSFTIDGGAADTAGIALGHILLSVNSTPVTDTDSAVKLVANSPRPLIMEYYIPPALEVKKTEGQCMVKYDTLGTDAPGSSIEWKGKYVVVGDMLGKPNMLYMYRSKAEYDIAVKEAQHPSRKLSVKIKQFDISHSHIFHENGQVSYPNQRNKWYYFTIVRPTGFPIKISCESREALRPIYEGVVEFLEKERRMDERMEERRRMERGGETFY